MINRESSSSIYSAPVSGALFLTDVVLEGTESVQNGDGLEVELLFGQEICRMVSPIEGIQLPFIIILVILITLSQLSGPQKRRASDAKCDH